MAALIEVEDLQKTYPGVVAVDGVSFRVARGSCFGLLGPNGAGKTTTMEMLEGITPPSGGTIRYKGRELDRRYREEIGIQFQTTALQDFQTVRESLVMFAALYERQADLGHLVSLCQLGDFLDRDTRKLSGGQRQRLLLAIALVNDPELIFLDEPTTGLDPQSRRNFWSLIEDIKAAGRTVLLTTHYMEEAHRLCDEVAIIDHGRIVAQGPPEVLVRGRFPSAVVRVPLTALPDPARLPGGAAWRNGSLEIFTNDVTRSIGELEALGADLTELKVSSPTLEDLFLELTGHALRG